MLICLIFITLLALAKHWKTEGEKEQSKEEEKTKNNQQRRDNN